MFRYQGRLCLPDDDDLRGNLIEEAHDSRYSIHVSFTKMYRDLREVYWSDGLERYIMEFVSKCQNFQQVKVENLMTSGLIN